MAAARDKVNRDAGARRLFSHIIFTPGQPGWLEQLDAGLALKPESVKGYTIGDNTHKEISRYPWRMDDEKVVYPGYERMVKAGIKNVCVHKGLFSPGVERQFPGIRGFADAADVGQAAKDWPQLNFVIYHGAYRHVGGDPKGRARGVQQDRPDRVDKRSRRHPRGVRRQQRVRRRRAVVCHHARCRAPRLRGADGHSRRGLGVERVCWGTDAVWTGSPQWQIEGLRRLEIPEAMQKQHGFKPLGEATGPVKTAIFGGNNARLYNVDQKQAALELEHDGLTARKRAYEAEGPARTNLRYGYVAGPIDPAVFAYKRWPAQGRVLRSQAPKRPPHRR